MEKVEKPVKVAKVKKSDGFFTEIFGNNYCCIFADLTINCFCYISYVSALLLILHIMISPLPTHLYGPFDYMVPQWCLQALLAAYFVVIFICWRLGIFTNEEPFGTDDYRLEPDTEKDPNVFCHCNQCRPKEKYTTTV